MSRFSLALSRAITLAAALVLLAACSSTPKQSVSPLPKLPANALRLDDRWSASVGDGSGEEAITLRPAVQAPSVFAASRDGVVRAFGRATGRLRWKQSLSVGITGGLSCDEDLLLLGTDQSDLIALNTQTGKPVWHTALGANLLSPARITKRDIIVQTLDGRVQVFNRADGKRRWQFDTPMPPLSLRGNAAPAISGDKLFAVSGQGDLYQLDLATGLPIWQTRVTSSRGRGEIERLMDIDGDLIVDDNGTLYTAGYQSQLTATDTNRVRRLWQVNISTTQSVATDAAHLYAVDVDGTLAALNKITGELIWKQEALKGRRLLAPVIWRGLIVVGDSDGWLHLFSPVDGGPRGRERADSHALMSVVVDAPQLLTLSVRGKLKAWDLLP